MITNSSDICKALSQYVMLDIKIKETVLLNSELPATHLDSKYMFLDALVVDDQGNYYNFEIQNYFKDGDYKRFHTYAFKVLTDQIDKGTNYINIKPVVQLIINGTDKDFKGLSHYKHHFYMQDQYQSAMLDQLYDVQLYNYIILMNLMTLVIQQIKSCMYFKIIMLMI